MEKHPSKVQTWKGTPFFTESATNQGSKASYLEIINPVVEPGQVFIIAMTEANWHQWVNDYHMEEVIDKIWVGGSMLEEDDGVNGQSTPANPPRSL